MTKAITKIMLMILQIIGTFFFIFITSTINRFLYINIDDKIQQKVPNYGYIIAYFGLFISFQKTKFKISVSPTSLSSQKR